MASTYETASDSYLATLDEINLVCTIVFITECCIKNIAYTPRGYFYSSWNKFDFFVVMTSVADLILTSLGSGLKFLAIGP
jgi:hypothetical protein